MGANVNWLRSLLTEDDAGQVPCPARIGWALGLVAYFIFTGIHMWSGSFDPIGFGTGFAAINTSGGIALLAKEKSGQ